ncbi:MAG: zinc-ribbon domain-containing protein [Clostridia bacterium]|nr:zinc-ribbon domain-containing protein [Clostridia bacterium]
MLCKYCGNELADDARFCSRCGKIVDVTEPLPEQPLVDMPLPETPPTQVQENLPENTPEKPEREQSGTTPITEAEEQRSGRAKTILIFAIIGCALSIVLDVALAGVVFSLIAFILSRKYTRTYGTTGKAATIGTSLAIVGLIVGTVLSCLSLYDLIVWFIDMI